MKSVTYANAHSFCDQVDFLSNVSCPTNVTTLKAKKRVNKLSHTQKKFGLVNINVQFSLIVFVFYESFERPKTEQLGAQSTT